MAMWVEMASKSSQISVRMAQRNKQSLVPWLVHATLMHARQVTAPTIVFVSLSHPHTCLCAFWCHSYSHNILKMFLYLVYSDLDSEDLQPRRRTKKARSGASDTNEENTMDDMKKLLKMQVKSTNWQLKAIQEQQQQSGYIVEINAVTIIYLYLLPTGHTSKGCSSMMNSIQLGSIDITQEPSLSGLGPSGSSCISCTAFKHW